MFPTNWLHILIFFSIPMYPLFNVIFYSLTSTFSEKESRATALGVFGYVSGFLIIGLAADRSSKGIFIMLKISVILASINLLVTSIFLSYTIFLTHIKKGKKYN